MGGNALKHLNPVRLTSEGVWKLYWRVAGAANLCGYQGTHLVPWTLDKKSHGDVDIVLKCEDFENVSSLFHMLHVPSMDGAVVRNGPVISIALPVKSDWIAPDSMPDTDDTGVRYAQVDLIQASNQDYRHTCFYFSGGGLGMLIGRVAAAHGLVFGMDGLRIRSCPVHPWSKDIVVTHNPLISLQSLGYRCDAASLEFNCEEDVWAYAMSSAFARPWMFVSSETNAENRSRDKQRPGFARFQNWLHKNYDVTRDNYLVFNKETDLFDYATMFPFVRTECNIDEVVIDQRESWLAKKKQISTWGMQAVVNVFDGITPEDAGQIIRGMQPLMPDPEIRNRLYRSDPEYALKLAEAAARIAGAELGHTPKA
jgi:hypothetical protein